MRRKLKSKIVISKLIVGLGNPGEKYEYTRHNLGWIVLDKVVTKYWPVYESEKYGGVLGEKGDIAFFKPLTFMNRSGKAVAQVVHSLKLDLSDILIVSDDLNLDFGTIRMRPSGSAGAHNGLQSVIDCLGSDDFPRLRIGIGPCPDPVPVRAFVLSRFPKHEKEDLDELGEAASKSVICWKDSGVTEAMDRYNGTVVK